jgi:integrase
VSDELVGYKEQSDSAGLVFPSGNSTPLRNGNFRRDVFDAAVEALGLKITPHNLRDTAASLAIQAGASVVAVARMLGHESAATTLNHYAGLFPTDLNDVADRLDSAARQTIAQQSAPPDTKEAPTKHRPETSRE